jgi:glucose-6-phosphate 1-epimerase
MAAPHIERIDFRGMPAVRWSSADGASAVATLQGAHLVSWIPAGGSEALYLSERSPFVAGRAIRGGIPVCFPQFADRGPLSQHGFARTSTWSPGDAGAMDGMAAVGFTLEQAVPEWPHRFLLVLTAAISGARLEVGLRLVNRGEEPFAFTAALHTYLRVSDASTASLVGLRGRRYLERGEAETAIEDRERFTAAEPIDRVYFAAPPATRLEEGSRAFHIEQHGFTDTVVWNPGRERTARMADMPPDGYREMLCVEAAVVDPPATLAPMGEWAGAQRITAT